MHDTVETDLLSVHPQLTAATSRKLRLLLCAISVSVPFTPGLNKLRQAADITDSRTLRSYLSYLEEGGLIRMLGSGPGTVGQLRKPEKIYLDNTNQQFALTAGRRVNMGTLRETFFASMASSSGALVHVLLDGDFRLDQHYTVEVGGKGKDFSQIRNLPDSCLFVDGIEHGTRARIPLWLVGFLY